MPNKKYFMKLLLIYLLYQITCQSFLRISMDLLQITLILLERLIFLRFPMWVYLIYNFLISF